MKLVTFFAGAGGLDLGFSKAGFDVIWANEYDKSIWETYEKNHKGVYLDKRSITDVPTNEVPDCDGIIGGPPCQSWSEAGAMRGLEIKEDSFFMISLEYLQTNNLNFFLLKMYLECFWPLTEMRWKILKVCFVNVVIICLFKC
jgi:DNA (cytosine-5)-methyltransferase 1